MLTDRELKWIDVHQSYVLGSSDDFGYDEYDLLGYSKTDGQEVQE